MFAAANGDLDISLLDLEWERIHQVDCAFTIRDLLRWAGKDHMDLKDAALNRRLAVIAGAVKMAAVGQATKARALFLKVIM